LVQQQQEKRCEARLIRIAEPDLLFDPLRAEERESPTKYVDQVADGHVGHSQRFPATSPR